MRSGPHGNLAVKLNRERQQIQPPQTREVAKTQVKYGIPVEEKLLYLLTVIVIVCISGFILSRYSLISQYNYEIETNKEMVKKTQEQNSSLKLKIDELSKRERILDIAQRELGMTSKNSTVRVLSH
ncbi:MAG TPA: cell division protein FtsL [Bacillota bacterium]|nr:cell division protein FtsL [Bacillota bacterium]